MIDMALVLLAPAFVFGAASVAFVWAGRSLPAGARRYGYAVGAATGVMALSYLIMGVAHVTVGAEVDQIRFLGYTGMWFFLILTISAIAGAGRQLTLLLLGVVLARLWITLGGWFLDGMLATLATLATFAALAVGISLLFGPFSRFAGERAPERALLFEKLKYLIVLAWIGLVVTGLVAEGSLGLTDDFVGQMAVMYVEAILLIGFGGIVVRSADALDAASSTSPFSLARNEGAASSDATDASATVVESSD
ncbi:rhodopsin [Natrialbaceae archaeon A-arb3/5]